MPVRQSLPEDVVCLSADRKRKHNGAPPSATTHHASSGLATMTISRGFHDLLDNVVCRGAVVRGELADLDAGDRIADL